MCQNCVDNGALSQTTYDAIQTFIAEYPETTYGPAHVVLDDCNVGDGTLRWCLGLIRAALSRNPNNLWKPDEDTEFMERMEWYAEDDSDDLTTTAIFLEGLLLVPEEVR